MAFRRHWLAFGDECAENGRRPLQEETRLEKYLGVPRRGGRREPRPTRAVSQELMKPIVRVLQAREMGSLSDHIQGVTCTAFHPTNPTLFSGSLDKARPSGLGVLVRPLCQSVKIFDLTRPPGHKKAFSVLQDVYAVHSICALLGVVLSPGIHPCGDFLFVGTAHQETGRSELDMPRLSVFIAAAVHRHSNVAKAFMSGRRRTGLLTLALSISWLALGPPPWTAASAPSWWRQGRPRKLHGSRAEVELLSQVARLLMPAEPLGELFRRFPAPAGWKGHYLDPDLAAYGVLNSPDAGLFVEYDGFWRHGEAEGRRNDARKTAALLAFAPPGSKVLRIGHFPLEEQTEAVQIRLKPWQGQGKSFANALSVLVRRMARDLGKDLCSAVRTRLIDFEEHGGCVDASHYAMSAHVRGADRNRTELLLPLRDLGMRKQEIAAVGVRCRPVGGSVRKTIMFLQIVGLSKAQIAKAVASFPSLLGYSIEDNLKPTVRWFAELGLNKAQIAKAVAFSSSLLGLNRESGGSFSAIAGLQHRGQPEAHRALVCRAGFEQSADRESGGFFSVIAGLQHRGQPEAHRALVCRVGVEQSADREGGGIFSAVAGLQHRGQPEAHRGLVCRAGVEQSADREGGGFFSAVAGLQHRGQPEAHRALVCRAGVEQSADCEGGGLFSAVAGLQHRGQPEAHRALVCRAGVEQSADCEGGGFFSTVAGLQHQHKHVTESSFPFDSFFSSRTSHFDCALSTTLGLQLCAFASSRVSIGCSRSFVAVVPGHDSDTCRL
ncbi:unnamed protein product [Effrenium voratum]|nr:unnamed protein product [Effrenium voratum]